MQTVSGEIREMTDAQYARLRDIGMWAEKESQKPRFQREWDQTVWFSTNAARIEGGGDPATTVSFRQRLMSIRGSMMRAMQGGTSYTYEEAAEAYKQAQADPYKCRSTMCIAGRVVFENDMEKVDAGDEESTYLKTSLVTNNRGGSVDVEARKLLGISVIEAERLFAAGNSIASVKKIVNRICDNHRRPHIFQEI